MSKLSAQEIQDFLAKVTRSPEGEPRFLVEEIRDDFVRVRMPTRKSHLRPGDTVSGPVQMTLADTAVWTLILYNLGLSAAASVTSSLNISFLSRPASADLLAEARLLKLGRSLAVAEVRIFSAEGTSASPAAHATVTYAVRSNSAEKGA